MAPEVFALAMVAMTRKKTRIGATAFNADTKRVPSNGMMTSAPGTASARIKPITRPTTIRSTKLVSFHFAMICFIFYPLYGNYMKL